MGRGNHADRVEKRNHPIHKKGDKFNCNNCGITLLNIAYKIFTSAIKKQMESYAEKALENTKQVSNKSTVDQFFTVRQNIKEMLGTWHQHLSIVY